MIDWNFCGVVTFKMTRYNAFIKKMVNLFQTKLHINLSMIFSVLRDLTLWLNTIRKSVPSLLTMNLQIAFFLFSERDFSNMQKISFVQFWTKKVHLNKYVKCVQKGFREVRSEMLI